MNNKEQKKIDLSIIVLNYNTRDLLKNCLESVSDREISTEVIVVDNGSTDGSVEMVRNFFPWVRLIKSFINSGFSAGNNKGLDSARGRMILLLNSDTVMEPGTMAGMVKFMDQHQRTGAATCKVVLPDGRPDPACHRGFPTPWAAFTYFSGLEKLFPASRIFGQYHQGFKPMDEAHEIDSPSGSFYLVKKEVVADVGYLDEDFFMYGEDLDWSYRIKRAGWRIMYVPQYKITHYKKKSGRESRNPILKKKTETAFYEAMKIFYRKYYLNKYPSWLSKIIFIMVGLRKKIVQL